MRSFSVEFKKIFEGLDPREVSDGLEPMLSECHNLIPLGNSYKLHEAITDLNANGVSWGVGGEKLTDVWTDDGTDVWTDDGTDTFTDD